MQRKITYKCELCGTEFGNKLECEKHEETCRNRRYYVEQAKARIKAYLQSFEAKGFNLSVRYESTTPSGQAVCLISLIDLKQGKKHKKS